MWYASANSAIKCTEITALFDSLIQRHASIQRFGLLDPTWEDWSDRHAAERQSLAKVSDCRGLGRAVRRTKSRADRLAVECRKARSVRAEQEHHQKNGCVPLANWCAAQGQGKRLDRCARGSGDDARGIGPRRRPRVAAPEKRPLHLVFSWSHRAPITRARLGRDRCVRVGTNARMARARQTCARRRGRRECATTGRCDKQRGAPALSRPKHADAQPFRPFALKPTTER